MVRCTVCLATAVRLGQGGDRGQPLAGAPTRRPGCAARSAAAICRCGCSAAPGLMLTESPANLAS